jgi:hypothetical protein
VWSMRQGRARAGLLQPVHGQRVLAHVARGQAGEWGLCGVIGWGLCGVIGWGLCGVIGWGLCGVIGWGLCGVIGGVGSSCRPGSKAENEIAGSRTVAARLVPAVARAALGVPAAKEEGPELDDAPLSACFSIASASSVELLGGASVEQGIDYGDQAIKLAERELAAAQVLVAGRCRAFERSEVARAQSLLTCAYQAVGSAKTLLGAA